MSSLSNLSVAIITFNEEKILAKTLDSVADFASEIIIVDSHSTDNTLEIAKKFNCKIFSEDWKGHIQQKNSALEKCSFDWILSLDADEVLSSELKKSILQTIEKPEFDGYFINRKTFYLGKLMNYAWQPDWKLRLVRKKSNPKWEGLNPHDYLVISGQTNKIKGDLIHYSYSGISHHFKKATDYAQISAESYINSGKKFKFANLLINPVYAFIRLYFLRRGFLDGTRGFIAAFSSLYGTIMKYIFLWDKEREKY